MQTNVGALGGIFNVVFKASGRQFFSRQQQTTEGFLCEGSLLSYGPMEPALVNTMQRLQW